MKQDVKSVGVAPKRQGNRRKKTNQSVPVSSGIARWLGGKAYIKLDMRSDFDVIEIPLDERLVL